MSEPIEVNGPWDDGPGSTPEGPPAWNRSSGKTAAEANLDGAPFGFKMTGDAAWDSGSDDYAMFSTEGNTAVAALVKTARLKARSEAEGQVLAWLEAEKERLAADEGQYQYLPHLCEVHGPDDRCEGMSEIWDTMVRETIAYALDETWIAAYGHSFGDEAAALGGDMTETRWSFTACGRCGAIVGITTEEGGAVDNKAVHRKWHEEQDVKLAQLAGSARTLAGFPRRTHIGA